MNRQDWEDERRRGELYKELESRPLPPCASVMRCLCAAHARCLSAPECNADEAAARELGPCDCCDDVDDWADLQAAL